MNATLHVLHVPNFVDFFDTPWQSGVVQNISFGSIKCFRDLWNFLNLVKSSFESDALANFLDDSKQVWLGHLTERQSNRLILNKKYDRRQLSQYSTLHMHEINKSESCPQTLQKFPG
jgi:hypothetical protein